MKTPQDRADLQAEPKTDPQDLPGLTYRDAGVAIDRADGFVDGLTACVEATHGPEVVPGAGQYASLFRPDLQGMNDPMLAAACDGVGTKLLVAKAANNYAHLGQDLVAMNVNDLVAVGAKPLFFLNYVATGVIDPEALTTIVASMAKACSQSGCALLGGETAEMPGLYPPGDFDLAGFAVGMRDGAPKPPAPAIGDKVLALPSNGVHANGFSLARKALLSPLPGQPDLSLQSQPEILGGTTLGDTLLEPTALYVDQVLKAWKHPEVQIKAAAHITGGGIATRAQRMLLPGQALDLHPHAIPLPPIFSLIQSRGRVALEEMANTFNLGLGFLIVVSTQAANTLLAEGPWIETGEIVAHSDPQTSSLKLNLNARFGVEPSAV